jgi:hypothetical protein
MSSTRFGSPTHLARRFLTSLRSTPPPGADDAWAVSHLLPGEITLWVTMSAADRRHAIGVGRATEALLGVPIERAVVAAALLHDVGKREAGLGTVARAGVTAVALVVGEDRLRGRAARYVRHSAIGADLLADAGSDPLTVAWTREHHLPSESWTVPPAVGAALKAADDG